MLRFHNKSVAYLLLVVSLGSIIFFPPYVFPVKGAEAGQKIVFGFCLLLFALTFLFYKRSSSYGLIGIALIFVPMTLFMALSSIVNGASLAKALNAFRYPAYLFILCYFVTLLHSLTLDRLVSMLVGFYWLQIAFCILQLLMPESRIVGYFSARDVFDYLGPRIGGTFEWSYSLAMFLTPFFVYFFLMWSNTNKIKYLLSLMTCCIVIILGQSKTAVVSCILVLCLLYVFCKGWRQKIMQKMIILVIGAAVLIMGFIAKMSNDFDLAHLNSAINMIYFKGALDPSAAYRFEQLNIAYSGFLGNLAFGDPRAYEITIENAYMDYGFRYGLPGLVLYLIFMIYVIHTAFFLLIKVVKRKEIVGSKASSMLIGICMTFFVFPIYAVSYSPSDAHRLSFWFYFTLAVAFAALKKIRHQAVCC